VAPPPPVSSSSSEEVEHDEVQPEEVEPEEMKRRESADALDRLAEEVASGGAEEWDQKGDPTPGASPPKEARPAADPADELEFTLTEEEPPGDMGLDSMELEPADDSVPPDPPATPDPAASAETPTAPDPPASTGMPDLVEDPEPAGEGEQNDAAFDFGGVDHLELEEEDATTGTEDAEPDYGDGMELEEPLDAREGAADPGAVDFGGGVEFEEPLSAQGGDADFGMGFGEDMELEQPMSEYSAESPPAWMEQDGPGDFRIEDDPEESDPDPPPDDWEAAASPGAAAVEDRREETPRAPSRTPRSRPSPPRRPKQSSLPTVLLVVLGLGIVGGAGWFGWRALQGGGAGADDLPPVTVPDIPAELLPTMRDVGEVALSNTMDELAAMQEQAELPAAPPGDWLAGVYLANAGDFSDVQVYWVGISDFVDRVRSSDTRIFHQEYEEALAAREIAGDEARILLERADSGFLATRNERNRVYGRMEELVDASLDLHGFLLENQTDIAYEPAAGGFSSDPVVEAVPASNELGDEMWSRVDRITAALDQLGTLDRVTTERLLAVLFEGIRSAGFQ